MVSTDRNWGPQDASKPKPNKKRTVTMEELKSIQGFYITNMGVLSIGESIEKREGVEAPVLLKLSPSMKELQQFSICAILCNN